MYKLSENGVTLTREDGSVLSIPNAEGNRHWREYQEWLAEGNTPEPQFTAAELQAKEDAEAVAASQQYLKDTDYIVLKLAEAMALGQDTTAMKAKYAEQLTQRGTARVLINAKGQ